MRKEVECPVSAPANVKVVKVPCHISLHVWSGGSIKVVVTGDAADAVRVSQNGSEVWVHGPSSRSVPVGALSGVEITVPRKTCVDIRGKTHVIP